MNKIAPCFNVSIRSAETVFYRLILYHREIMGKILPDLITADKNPRLSQVFLMIYSLISINGGQNDQ